MGEDHTIMGGKVHVYRRENSRFWQCSTYLAGKNRRVSTKEDSLSRAKDFAEDWYLGLRGLQRSGAIVAEKTFKTAAQQFEREYEVITGGQRNPAYVEGHSSRLRNHLLPFFPRVWPLANHARHTASSVSRRRKAISRRHAPPCIMKW